MKKPLQNPTSNAPRERSKLAVTKQPGPRIKPLSAKARGFTEEYLIDFNGARAARAVGYKPGNARAQACDLLNDPRIQAKVAEHAAKHSAKATATVAAVLDRLWAGANADAREFSELHRVACRHCHGVNHRHQFTQGEMEASRLDWASSVDRDEASEASQQFDERGGVGYSAKWDPHPNCTECYGYGIERVIIKDTRDLSPSAVKVYAGVKTTQRGIEIKQHDPIAMLLNVGKQLGMFSSLLSLGCGTNADADLVDGCGYALIPAKKLPPPPESSS